MSRLLTNDPSQTPETKAGPLDALSGWIGKPVTLFIIFLATIGIGMFLSARLNPPSGTQPPAADSTPTATPASLPAENGAVTPTLPAPKTKTPTPAPTNTPRFTATPTSTPIVYKLLNGSLIANQTACRAGPGNLYLYQTSLLRRIKMQVLGRDLDSDWAYVQAEGLDAPCWVDLRSLRMDGLPADLEPVYPQKASLPFSELGPAPQNINASRIDEGTRITIYWDEYLLPDSDRESLQSPRYLAELWLCKGGELTFTILFLNQPNLLVTDEEGCSQPSSGVVYLAAKDGYAGPAEIPWP